ncbi:srg family chemoreceptor domain-containing protein [Ditylenchus destructor]|uniref:Serpentine receptor class gamma n=1 Tax=Ditylenchus destructor TaxID=166010 RepID=A0AAD4R397_9BILA|nr:srg family chemoreceptor domain-containing protein [Ditylenchus destructor]
MIGSEPLPYIVQLSIEFLFVLFHVSVTICIAWNIWKGRAALSSGFFLIYLVQSVCDLASYLLTVVFYRMPKIQAIPDSILVHPVGTLAVFIINWLFYLQCVFHATIAVNRYTMIIHPDSKWDQVWSGGYIKALITCLILISMLPAIPRLWCNTKAVNHELVCDYNNQAKGRSGLHPCPGNAPAGLRCWSIPYPFRPVRPMSIAQNFVGFVFFDTENPIYVTQYASYGQKCHFDHSVSTSSTYVDPKSESICTDVSVYHSGDEIWLENGLEGVETAVNRLTDCRTPAN